MNLGVRLHRTSLALSLVSLTLALFSLACVNEASELNKAGVALESRNSLEESIVKFDEAIRLDPRLALAYYNRGQAYFILGQFEPAKQDYDQAVNLDPESILFYTKRGDAYLAMGQPDQAVQEHNEAIGRDPQFGLAYYNRGSAYVALGRRDEAIQDYNQAVILDRRIRITTNIGVRCKLYDDLYPKDVAYQDCRGFSSHGSRFANAFGERAFEYFERGEYRKAIMDYDQAIRLDRDRDLYNGRGLAYQSIGEFDQAFQDFEKAAGSSGFAPAHYNQGKLLYEIGKYRFAAKEYSLAILKDPLYADAYTGRAMAYTFLAKDALAKLDIDRAVELGVDRVELEGVIQELEKQR